MHRFFTLILAMIFMTFIANNVAASKTKKALFAGGCFWCMQPGFDNTPGVISTHVGYAGGTKETATYAHVSSGRTGHVEVIEIIYDPVRASYETLLQTYWENIDPTDGDGQFADRGSQYMPAIYYADETQKLAAENSLRAMQSKFAPKPIQVKILPAPAFYPAEDYHQRYYEKNSAHYNAYKIGSGRAAFLKSMWDKK